MLREVITLVIFAIVAALFIGAAVSAFQVKCDPKTQHCIEHQHGPVQPGETIT